GAAPGAPPPPAGASPPAPRARRPGAAAAPGGGARAAATAKGADVRGVADREAIPALIAGMARPGDLVLTMGAGDVTDLGPRIVAHLES
ncbi:hypothetical protein AAHZ94_34640, partial [Streptomyces sp. HSW2009]